MTDATTTLAQLKARMAMPVICAPMFLVTGPDMVIAACKSGVIGCFPATNARTDEQLREWLTRISQEVTTQEAPWSMNMITHTSYGRFEAELEMVQEFSSRLWLSPLWAVLTG